LAYLYIIDNDPVLNGELRNKVRDEINNLINDQIPPPKPSISIINEPPSAIEIGESFDLKIGASNIGGDASYGSITVSMPQFLSGDDAQQVEILSSTTDLNKVDFYPKGDTRLNNREGTSFASQYLTVEYGDSPWITQENQEMSLSITPKSTGTFDIYIRANMGNTETGTYYNMPIESEFIDHQGWPVIKKTITVESSPNEPPVAEIINGPADGSTINSSSVGFKWTGSDNDGSVISFEVELTGPKSDSFETSYDYTDFTGLPNGDYVFRVRAIDNEGAVSEWASRSFTVEVVPTISVTQPTGGETWQIGTQQTIEWNSTDLSGKVDIELHNSQGKVSEIAMDTPDDGSESWTIPNSLNAGTDYKVIIYSANDRSVNDESDTFEIVNNGGESITISVTVTPEGTGEVQGTGSYSMGEEVTLEATPLSNDFAFDQWNENGSEVNQENPWSFTAESDRNLTARFVSISNIPPEITITDGPDEASTINSNNTSFAWSGNDVDGTVIEYEVELVGPSGQSPQKMTSERIDYTELADGSYTFRVRAIDDDEDSSVWSERNFTVDTDGTTAPDLIVETLSLSPASPKEGDSITFTFGIANQGDGAAGAFDWQLTVNGENVDSDRIASLNAGTSTSKSFKITSVLPGTYTVTLKVDVNEEVAESNEENNEDSKTFTVEKAKPILSVDPTSVDVGPETGTTTFQVSNDGNGTLEWGASTQESWLSFEGSTSGTGSGTFRVVYTENDTPNDRTGIVMVSSSNAENSPIEIAINQMVVPPPPPPPPTTIAATYSEGWNLVSIPEEVFGQSITDYFSTIIGGTDIYEFDGQYVEMQSLETGKGYWLKLGANEEVEFTGQILGSLTLDLEEGWNLVGTVGDTLSVPGDLQDPNGIIENGTVWALDYDDGTDTYELVETTELLPGKGYFIKANSAGEIVLSIQ